MTSGDRPGSSGDKKSDERRGGDKRTSGKSPTSAADRPQRRGFSQPGRTKVERNKDLPVERQIRALLKNPTPSPAEQNRLCELTRTKSYRAAVGVAKRMLVPPTPEPARVVDQPTAPRRRNSR